MNVATISMPVEEAERKLAAYRVQLRRRANEEYSAAAKGYAALAQGRPLLNLSDAFNSVGVGEDGRPRLAIARADRTQVGMYTSWRESNTLIFDTRQRGNSFYRGTLLLSVPVNYPTGPIKSGFSLVPMVPADVRPNGDLRNYFVLWEVEQWASQWITAVPDRDPYLLQHLAGDLYIVVAEWDLTELERAIMSGRRDG